MVEVLITGASGFTGSALAKRLSIEPGFNLNLVSRRDPNVGAVWRRYFPDDLQDVDGIRKILKETRPDWIFHLAGALKGSPSELFRANLQTTVNLLEAAEVAPNARVLLIGSAAEYGVPANDSPISEEHPCNPVGPYGVSKFAMTLAGLDCARRTKLQVNIARTFNLIGPAIPQSLLLGAVIERARNALELGKDCITVGDVSTERDFIDVRDAAEAYVAIIRSDARGEIFNVCSGVGTRISELVSAALKFAPRHLRYDVDPNLGSGGAKSVVGDPRKLAGLGFQPRISLERSVEESCAVLRGL